MKGRLIEVVGGIEIREKVPSTAPPYQLAEGQLVRGTRLRDVWRVERITPAGAYVRSVAGRSVGSTATWSSSSAGHKFVTEEELTAERAAAAAERAAAADENTCPNCWPQYSDGERDELGAPREAMGRDPNCREHQVKDLPTVSSSALRRRRTSETSETIAKVLELRAAGKTFKDAAAALGWDAEHGPDRAYKIFHAAQKKAQERAPGIRPSRRTR